jgi:hypothetical protein
MQAISTFRNIWQANLRILSSVSAPHPKQTRADAMEGASPGRASRRRCPHHLARNPLDPLCHLGRSASREGHQKNSSGVNAIDDQMGDAMRKCVGLARSGSGNCQQRRKWTRSDGAMFDGTPLLRIEVFEVGSNSRHVRTVPWSIDGH